MSELSEYLAKHGARVRRGEAMAMLSVESEKVWQNVLDANPQLKHRLPGEGQSKYSTAEIFRLLPERNRGAAGVEEAVKSSKLKV